MTLDKALFLAEQHKQTSPGEFVRVLWKQAHLLMKMGAKEGGPEVAQKLSVAKAGRQEIEEKYLPELPPDMERMMDEDARYDRLVCAFSR